MEVTPGLLLEKIYKFTLACGNFHDPKSFVIESLTPLKELCPFDRATIYFFDPNGRVSGQYLTDSDKHWSSSILSIIPRSGASATAITGAGNGPGHRPIYPVDWSKEPGSEFVADFIIPRGITHSVGILLCDLKGIGRSMVCLDRKSGVNFSQSELQALTMAAPIMKTSTRTFIVPPSRAAQKQPPGRRPI